MSSRDLFKELTKKDYNIEITDQTRWEIQGNKVIIYKENGEKVEIEDERIVTAARAHIDEEFLKDYLSKEGLIKRIYAIKFTYMGVRTPFSEFAKEYENKTPDEIYKELRDLEKTFIEGRGLTYEDVRKDIIDALISYGIKSKKLPYVPAGISYQKISLTTQELAEIILQASERKKFSLTELFKL